MSTTASPALPGATDPPRYDREPIPEPLINHYSGAYAVWRQNKTGKAFEQLRYRQMNEAINRLRPYKGKAWSMADRYFIGRLVGSLLLGPRRENWGIVDAIAFVLGISRRSLYAHVKVAQVFPDEDPANPLVYLDDEGHLLDWSQLSAIADAAGEPGQREYWLTVCRRRKLNASGVRCAGENRDIMDPMVGRVYGCIGA